MEEGETFEPNYVFFTAPEQVLSYCKENGLEVDCSLYKALNNELWERIPAGYHLPSKKTFMFTFNLPTRVRFLGVAKKLLGRIPGLREKAVASADNCLAGEYVFLFNHEYLHELMDRFLGDDFGGFKSPRGLREMYMLNDLVNYLVSFEKYKGPFSEPRKIPKH
jgi:hypothetical protein